MSSKRRKGRNHHASGKATGPRSDQVAGGAFPSPTASATDTGRSRQTGPLRAPAAFVRPSVVPDARIIGVRRSRRQAPRPATDPQRAFFAVPADERQTVARGCAPAALEGVGMDGVAPTYSFQAPEGGGFYDLTVRFVGRRKDVTGEPASQDSFERVEHVTLPANGEPASLTAKVQPVNPGEWRVLAEPLDPAGEPDSRFPRRVIEIGSQFGPLAQGPRVWVWAWPALVGLGAAVALVVQAWLAHRTGLGVVSVLVLSLVGCLLGFAGGKLWFLGLHRQPVRQFLTAGACVQGFLVVSLTVLAGGAALLGLRVGDVLDITAPGILLGVAVGRPGCFFAGCCAGRPTSSAWGLVSSDRRITVRRLPVQLLEASTGLVLGAAALVVILLAPAGVPGSLFVASLAAYTFVRQLLFGLRVESRTQAGRAWTLAITALLVLGAAGTYAL